MFTVVHHHQQYSIRVGYTEGCGPCIQATAHTGNTYMRCVLHAAALSVVILMLMAHSVMLYWYWL